MLGLCTFLPITDINMPIQEYHAGQFLLWAIYKLAERILAIVNPDILGLLWKEAQACAITPSPCSAQCNQKETSNFYLPPKELYSYATHAASCQKNWIFNKILGPVILTEGAVRTQYMATSWGPQSIRWWLAFTTKQNPADQEEDNPHRNASPWKQNIISCTPCLCV